MALFDFIKKQRKQEKESTKAVKRERTSDSVEKSSDTKKSGSVPVVPADSFVLIAPHVTERARIQAEEGKYTFRIKPTATKRQVRESVERFYNVHVNAVNIVKAHEKPRRRGLTEGVKKGYKKAVVALRTGEAIDIF